MHYSKQYLYLPPVNDTLSIDGPDSRNLASSNSHEPSPPDDRYPLQFASR